MDNWGNLCNNWGMDSMSNNWSNSVGNHSISNNWGMSYNWSSMCNHSWPNMWGKVSSRADNSSNIDGSMMRYIRGWGSGSKTEESSSNESLHFCSVTVQSKLPC